jgi:hypothetical protein
MPAPLFNEINLIDGWPNWQSRNGQKPRYAVLHTTEGAGGMELVNYMRNASVSYHYVIDNDGTVYDLVDTNDASWSVLDANNYCINYVFGASRAAWSAQQWLDKMGRAIQITARLVAQDLIKYNIPPVVSIGRPYTRINAGVIDHRYVTEVLGIGSHTDVGDGFPVDVFKQHLMAAYNELKPKTPGIPPVKPPTPPTTPVAPPKPAFSYPSQAEMVIQIWEQLFGPRGRGWPQLGGHTLVDAVAELEKRLK